MLLALVWSAGQPKIEHLPEKIDFKQERWMDFVPSKTEHLIFLNYTAVLEQSEDLLPSKPLINIVGANVSILPREMQYISTLTLPNAGRDSTIIQLMKPLSQAMDDLSAAVSPSTPQERYSGVSIYKVINRIDARTPQLIGGYMVFISEHAIFAIGGSDALAWLKTVIDTDDARGDRLFDGRDIRYARHLSGNARMGFSMTLFQSVVPEAKITLRSLDLVGGQLMIKAVLSFPSTDVAVAQAEAVRRAYPSWFSYRILDNFMVVSRSSGMEGLAQELGVL